MKKREYHAAEFARLAGITKKTLQYYDEIGLFRPIRVEANGYRVYDVFQLDRLALIAALKDLGMSLEQIRTYLTHTDPAQLDRLLAVQSRELARRMELLEQRRAMLEGIRSQNQEFLRYCGQGPQLLCRPAQRMTVLATQAQLEQGQGFMVNYLTDGLYTGLCTGGGERFLYQRRGDGELPLPGGRYLCLFEQAEDPSQSLAHWARAQRPRLEASAAARGLALGQRMYIEVNELTPGRDPWENPPLWMLQIPVEEAEAPSDEAVTTKNTQT